MRLLLTGANGVLGSAFVRKLAERHHSDVELVGVFSSPASYAAFAERLGAEIAARIRHVVCDLADPCAVETLTYALGRSEGTMVVHAAASVAWNRPLSEMWRPNVEATRAVAMVARRTSRTARVIYVSSAYADNQETDHRNTYEATKTAAESALRAEFPDLRPIVFAPSLIVGSSVDGRIDAFHGVYPLLELVADEVPFLVGSRTARIDIVPVDWVAAELLALVQAAWAGEQMDDVVASAGQASLALPDLVALAVRALNSERALERHKPVAQTPVLSFRQWRFIKQSLEAWDVTGIDQTQLARFERILGIYEPYLRNSISRAPRNVRATAPCPSSYLARVVRYWWHCHHRHRSAPAVRRVSATS